MLLTIISILLHMFELVFCIVACALLVIGFKIFEKLKIDAFQAIVVNYGTAGLIGFLVEPNSTTILNHIHQPWFLNGIILGIVFIINFYIMAQSTQKMGASVTSVASKMSLVITVFFGIIYFHESIDVYKIIGILLALASVLFIVQINPKEVNRKFIILPIILFFGGGFIDISLNYNQVVHLKEGGSGFFSMITFSAAFIAGFMVLIYRLISGKEEIRFKNIIGGIILGAINWFSIFLLLLTLKNPLWKDNSSTVYTIVNIGILLLVVLCGVFVFKEKLNRKQWLGIGLAVLAILMISLA